MLRSGSILAALAVTGTISLGGGAVAGTIVNVSATANGEETGGSNCFIACEGALISPVQITLGPGTYTVTDAYGQRGAAYDAWNYSSGWVWHWKALIDDGSQGSTITPSNYDAHLLVDVDRTQIFGTEAEAAALGQATTAQFTLTTTTTVDFVVNDYFLPDNTGGVSLLVSGAPEPANWALMFVGVGAIGAVLRTRRRGLASARS